MSRFRRALFLAGALTLAWLGGRWELAPAADLPLTTCSADRPAIGLGGTVALKVWAQPPTGQTLRYGWEAQVGQMRGAGAQARWNLTGLPPGTYAATATVRSSGGDSGECIVRVVVYRVPGPRGGGIVPQAQPARETGSALLVPGVQEGAGYGLYSYLLLGAPPGEGDRVRYVKAIEAYSGLIPDLASLEQYVRPPELNVAYLPVRAAPPQSVSTQWMLDNYDYARARSLLRYLRGTTREGPYIVSALTPIGASGLSPDQYLFQDLSTVPPSLIATWVKEFLNQAAQERFWDQRTGARFALKLRLTIGVLGEGLPEVRKALDTWVAWTH
jgi:hypothetical protein